MQSFPSVVPSFHSRLIASLGLLVLTLTAGACKKDSITQTLKNRKEQLRRTAYLSAARSDADVGNHLARRLVANWGKL